MDNFSSKTKNGFSNDNMQALNPLELWKQMYFLSEKSWIELVNTMMATDSTSRNMTQFMDAYLDFEKLVRKGMDQYFQSVPVPSKNDIARVAKLVIGVEDKVEDLDLSLGKNLDRLVHNLSALIDSISREQQERARKEAEIHKVREAMDALNHNLSSLNDKIDKLSTRISALEVSNETAKKKSDTPKRTRSRTQKKQPEENDK